MLAGLLSENSANSFWLTDFGQVVEVAQPEHFEKLGGRPVERFTTLAHFTDDQAQTNQLPKHAARVGAPRTVDFSLRCRLAIGDQRNHVEGWLIEPGFAWPAKK